MKQTMKALVTVAAFGFAAAAVADDEIIDITAKLRDESGVALTLVEGTAYQDKTAKELADLFTADTSADGRALFKTREILVGYDVKDAYEPDKEHVGTDPIEVNRIKGLAEVGPSAASFCARCPLKRISRKS